MEHIVVIANPVASQFTGGGHRDVMARLSARHEVEALWPASPSDATAAALRAVEDGATTVVAMGGDGMVHHVAQGLIGSQTALGIIPAGTTNVTARLFGIPSRHSRAARLILDGPKPVPVGTARLTLHRRDTETIHNAVFACGLGLDAEVVRVADSEPYRKYRFGSLHYARSALGVGVKGFPSVRPHVTLAAEDREAVASTALVQFRSLYTYFGKIALRFGDTPPDPMSVLVMERLRRRRIPRIASRALTGRDLARIPEIAVWPQVGSLSFTADPPVAAQADGEGLGLADGGIIEWAPDSLLVIGGD